MFDFYFLGNTVFLALLSPHVEEAIDSYENLEEFEYDPDDLQPYIYNSFQEYMAEQDLKTKIAQRHADRSAPLRFPWESEES